MEKNTIQSFDDLKIYLDSAICRWRNEKKQAMENREEEYDLICACYIDAFQSVRMSVFGELLPREVE